MPSKVFKKCVSSFLDYLCINTFFSPQYFKVVLQLLFIGDMSKRHVYLPEHDRNKPGRQIVTFLLICNITMWILFTFESQKVLANPVQVSA